MKIPVHVIDFETQAIVDGRPAYPPVPVGYSLLEIGAKKIEYHGWGHPSANNTTLVQAKRRLKSVWYSKKPMLFHNAKFDVDIAQTHMDCGHVPWELIHDTMFLLFLQDPHAPNFKLKESADRLLNLKAIERDELKEWILSHKKALELEYGEKIKPSEWGAWISRCPGDIVGKYANGDVLRTLKLFEKLHKEIKERGMLPAYDRERELMPILLENERLGMRVDVSRLRKEVREYTKAKETADEWLRKRLKNSELNVDSDAEFAYELRKNKIVTDFVLTPTGKDSTSKKNLKPSMFRDKKVAQIFGYRNRLSTCLNMFMEPWLLQAPQNNGYISTTWNQVRQSKSGNDAKGTRTGRPSTSNPNFLNLSKDFYDKNDGYEHPAFIGESLPELPLVRKYILPDPGHIFLHRDYNQQELRILAHFEEGALAKAYQENPRLDVHNFVQKLILEVAKIDMQRRAVKVINFQKIYGGGQKAISQALETTIEEARKFIDAHAKALPGVKELNAEIRRLAKSGEPVLTWGGREYYPEPPKMIDGRMMEFIYKLLNYIIQGSASDCTKQAIIDYHKTKKSSRFLVSVYDENNISAPKSDARREMEILRLAMENQKFSIPMLTDGAWGKSWGELKDFK